MHARADTYARADLALVVDIADARANSVTSIKQEPAKVRPHITCPAVRVCNVCSAAHRMQTYHTRGASDDDNDGGIGRQSVVLARGADARAGSEVPRETSDSSSST